MCSCLHMWLSPTSLFPMSLIPFSFSLLHCVWKLFFSFRFFALKYPFHVQHMCLFLCAGCRVPLSLPSLLPCLRRCLNFFIFSFYFYRFFFIIFSFFLALHSLNAIFRIARFLAYAIGQWPPPLPSLSYSALRQRFTRSFSLCVRFFTLALGLSYSTFFLFFLFLFFFFFVAVF